MGKGTSAVLFLLLVAFAAAAPQPPPSQQPPPNPRPPGQGPHPPGSNPPSPQPPTGQPPPSPRPPGQGPPKPPPKGNNTNCSQVVNCPPPRCPDPIAANHTAGKCCDTCPPGSRCPVAGQVFQSCASPCNATCSNPTPFCVLVCRPGCACPSGQVIDTRKNRCVPVVNCSDDKDDGKAICELAPDEENCEAYAELFFYNSTSKACEIFIYGGCDGNGNRFSSEKECYKKCGDKDKPRNCSQVNCPSLDCEYIRPANPEKGRCCPTCAEGPPPTPGPHPPGSRPPRPHPTPGPHPPSSRPPHPHQTPGPHPPGSRPPRPHPTLGPPPPGSRPPRPHPTLGPPPPGSRPPRPHPSLGPHPPGSLPPRPHPTAVPKPPTDCNRVPCPPVSCPDPIPADPANGSCCRTCPVDSTCPVVGQFFDSCGSACPTTCANHDDNLGCIEVCSPGCHCPFGQVIDEESNSCVAVKDCPVGDICQLPAKKGNCRAKMTRYYYNSDAGKCQQFTYGGCNGNENNFQTMRACRKECEKSSIDCSAVKCAVPTCPDPIASNPAEGECCSKCPQGSTCPFKGQVYHECIGCPPTCANYDQIVPCPLICLPGCACPTGTVLDEQSSTCVAPEQCPGKCELHPEVGVCRGYNPRYFYNATSKQCEKFIYGGCGGNENNFETLSSCLNNCSECAPACTPDFCKGKLQAKCSICDNTPGSGSCFGGCDETICSACYYSNETLLMPTLEEDCPTLCPVDAMGEIFGMTCLRDWGKCVRSANLDTYGKPTSEMKTAENFKCWRPSCQSHA